MKLEALNILDSFVIRERLPQSFDQTPVMVPPLSRSPRPESLPLLDFPRPVHYSSLLCRYSWRFIALTFPPVLLRYRGLSRWKRFDERSAVTVVTLGHESIAIKRNPVCQLRLCCIHTRLISSRTMLSRFEERNKCEIIRNIY